MNSETVDLIATDPPFNTKRNRAGTAGFYVDNWKWGDTGKLPDQWAWNEVHPVWLEEIRDDNPALYEVIEAAEHCHGPDIAAFLCFLSVRLLEMHRILKPTGSLYLHCDHSANAYIRMALDAIFGAKNFRNEIVWFYPDSPGRPKKDFPRKHDTIFRYSKSQKQWTFNTAQIRIPIQADSAERYKTPRVLGGYSYTGGESAQIGKIPETVWRIPVIKGNSAERTGYPDQKPIALYERIVLASSNHGDLVMDPFAGCATTIMAAQKNERRWVGIDRRPDARHHVVCRMLGMKADEAEKQTRSPMYGDWITAQLAELNTQYRTTAPVRTDSGDTAAPFLAAVHAASEKSLLSHHEMKDYLLETFGLQCWGCSFLAPDERYLELDHVDPKADGGSNHLDNRALLCKPCNGAKSNNLTMGALRRQNTKDGHLTKPPGTKRGDDGHPIRLPEVRAKCRDALERHRRGQPMQLAMLI